MTEMKLITPVGEMTGIYRTLGIIDGILKPF